MSIGGQYISKMTFSLISQSVLFSILVTGCIYVLVIGVESKSVLCLHLEETSGGWYFSAFHSMGVIEMQASTRVSFSLCVFF